MRVLITGGSGLLGRALAQDLSAGYEVVILSRNPDKVKDLPAGVQAVAWDGHSAAGWGSLADGAQAIVNLAGESIKGDGFLPSRWTTGRKQRIRQSRLNVGAAVAEALREAKHKPKVLLQASAVGYYGPRGDEPVTESDPPGNDFLARVCTAWEASTAEVDGMGVRRAVLRTGLPLTMQGGAMPLLVLPFRLFAGNIFSSGRQYYPWIHIRDYIAALRFLIEDGRAQGVFNVTAPHPVSNRDFARTLGRVMRRPVWLPAPASAVRLAMGEVSTVVLDGQNAVPQGLMERGFQFQFPELQPALENLLQ
ncbi:MAG: TIGR01777 family oxidoreductase [Anaerolineales bacterium]|nr:TIGR01777 family oxidoreductase [Anaerolineales bacterium]